MSAQDDAGLFDSTSFATGCIHIGPGDSRMEPADEPETRSPAKKAQVGRLHKAIGMRSVGDLLDSHEISERVQTAHRFLQRYRSRRKEVLIRVHEQDPV